MASKHESDAVLEAEKLIEGLVGDQADDRWTLVDARAPGQDAFLEARVPGAHHVDLDRDLAAPVEDASSGGRHPLPAAEAWREVLARIGAEVDTSIAVYDEQGGGMAAARAWWLLRASGHRQVAIVDGGWEALVEAMRQRGVEPERGPIDRSGGGSAVGSARSWSGDWQLPTSTCEEVERWRLDPERRVLDVRSRERFRGEQEPFDPVAGHVPGAVVLPWTEALENGRLRSPAALRETFRDVLGGVPMDRVVVHCGSGVTACHTLWAMQVCGLEGARLWVGSWSEWCRRDLPVAAGDAELPSGLDPGSA